MYKIETHKITDWSSAQNLAETLFKRVGKEIQGYSSENGRDLLAAMLLYLSRQEKFSTVYLYRFYAIYSAGIDKLLKRLEEYTDIREALTELYSLLEKQSIITLKRIWDCVRDVVLAIDSFEYFNIEEYRQKRSDILDEIKRRTQDLSALTERYIRTCPESEWIGKRVRAYVATDTPGMCIPIGTGYLKEILHLKDTTFYYQIYLENEDGTLSQETYTGPVILKVELM